MAQMVYFYTNILILSGFTHDCSSLNTCGMLCSFYRHANVEIYLLALMLLNVQLFPKTFRWALGNSEMKLCNV